MRKRLLVAGLACLAASAFAEYLSVVQGDPLMAVESQSLELARRRLKEAKDLDWAEGRLWARTAQLLTGRRPTASTAEALERPGAGAVAE
jgi:hypothetical protein